MGHLRDVCTLCLLVQLTTCVGRVKIRGIPVVLEPAAGGLCCRP